MARRRAAYLFALAGTAATLVGTTAANAQVPYLVEDVDPGTRSGAASLLPQSLGRAVFGARDGIWTTDGTAAATRRVDPLPPCPAGSTCDAADPRYQGAAFGTELAVLLHRNQEPPSLGMYSSIRLVDVSRWAGRAVPGETVDAFCANALNHKTDGLSGLATTSSRALTWKLVGYANPVVYALGATDGTSALSTLAPTDELCAQPDRALEYGPTQLYSVGNAVVFGTEYSGGSGPTPAAWRSDGTPAGTFPLIVPPPGSPSLGAAPDLFTTHGGSVYFRARSGDGSRKLLWVTDGTTAGTHVVLTPPGTDGIKSITATDGGLLVGTGPASFPPQPGGAETIWANALWTLDSQSGTMVHLMSTGEPFAVRWRWSSWHLLYGPSSQWLWHPANGTQMAPFRLGALAPFGAQAYAACDDGVHGFELCRIDSLPSGITFLGDINPGPASSDPSFPWPAGSQRLVFVAEDGVHGFEPWAIGPDIVASVGDALVTEPASGTAMATFEVSISPAPAGPVTVQYQTSDGTALAGPDYDAVSGTLTLGPSQTTGVIAVTVRGDGRDGPDKRFHLDLVQASGATILTGRGTATMTDVDPEPVVQVADAAGPEGTGPDGSAVMSLTLSAPSNFTVTVAYGTANGDAQAAIDYRAASGVVTFAPGVTQTTLPFALIGDAVDEPNEAFLIGFTAPQHASLSRNTAQAVILDDDGRAALCRPIAYVPFAITSQGRHCLSRNVSTAITSGAAIDVQSDFVVLDLKGFKIGGGSAGFATLADGVRAVDRRNVTVRNGNIRGFARGVALTGALSQAHVVEGLRLDENTQAAIQVEGTGHVVRRNAIVATGGSTTAPNADVYGIRAEGPLSRVIGNEVTDTTGVGTGRGVAVQMENAGGAVVEANRVGRLAASPGTVGIDVGSGQDVAVMANRIVGTEAGIRFAPAATGRYRDNVTSGVTVPYAGGTDAGNNQ